MNKEIISILNDVIYLDIETTGFHEEISEIIEIGAIKIKDNKVYTFNELIKPKRKIPNNIYDICKDLKEEELLDSKELDYIKGEVTLFLEKLPIICNNTEILKKFFKYHIPEVENNFLNVNELATILEPYHKEFTLEHLVNKITNINKKESNRALEDAKDIIIITNALLCRLWAREENKKNKFYNILVQDYGLLNKWIWTQYLEKPLFFNYDKYDHVVYSIENTNRKSNLMNIDYNKFEELLEIKEIWTNGGDFNYQYREEQKDFSNKIRLNIEKEEKIFIEAPTGSGKTFAYLLIIILEAYKNINKHKREDASFIISTDTKELQNQLINKDIPNILNKLGLEDKIKYGAIKGKRNYICIDKLKGYKSVDNNLRKILGEIYLKVLCKDGNYGDIENINYFAYNHFQLDEILNEVRCDNDECNLERCRRKCYLRKRYLELPDENITVINHSLLASWPYGEKKKITHLILDEAHNLMDKCYDFFSEEFNTFEFNNILNQAIEVEPTIFRALKSLNSSTGYKEIIDEDKIKYWVVEINKSINLFLSASIRLNLVKNEYNFACEYNLARDDIKEKVLKLRPIIENTKENIFGLYSLINKYLNGIVFDDNEFKDDKEFITINNYLLKLKSAVDIIDIFLDDKNNRKYAKVIEISKDYSNYLIRNIPLNVDELFNECILKEVKSTSFLSATMRINNSFNRIKEVLGQNEANELVVPPTFDLKNRTRIFCLNDLGRYSYKEFKNNSAKFIFEMAKKLNGHILVLFTNNLRLKQVEEELGLLLKGSRIEVYTNKKAIKYLNDKKRQIIILGSKGFFEGIDIPGDGLTAVILDKLPNKNIEDPLLKAITTYKAKDYKYYNYPQLCIKVKQIYGRLIRSIMDCGYFCILDGGNNKKTLQQLQFDLGGPMILNISSNNLFNLLDKDFYKWKIDNLNNILNSLKNNNEKYLFEDESKKRKSFWEITKEDEDDIYYSNLNIRVKRKK